MTCPAMFRTQTHAPSRTAGFGLIELMVAVGIMALVTSMVLVRQSAFNSAVLLENQAYEVAFDIRQTQLRAVSTQAGTTEDFYGSYEIEFTVGDRFYDVFQVSEGGSRSRVGARLQVDPRFEIVDIVSVAEDGSSSSIGNSMAIRFSRPTFDASFGSGNAGVAVAGVVIRSREDDTRERRIEVSNTGQISVERP